MRSKMMGTICLVLGIIIIVSTGTSFAYFSASADINDDNITGTTIDFDIDLIVEETNRATRLIPLEDNLISKAVKNNCKDAYGYDVCSLYKIILTNNGEPQILNGHISAVAGTTYITDNLKGLLFNSNLSEQVSSILPLTDNEKTNLEEKRYFKTDDAKLFTTDITDENIFYLAIWITETHDYQTDDYSKEYFGKIAFESIGGQEISANFSA